MKKGAATSGTPLSHAESRLRHFDQLDFAVLAPVQHVDPALTVADDKPTPGGVANGLWKG